MIGIIGTGWGTRAQIPAFKAAGLEVTALAARNLEKTQQLAHDLDIGFATTDWHDLIARDDVQFVSIVTPPSTHKEIALAALKAGKYVLCEKPMAMDATETQAMVDAALAYSGSYAIIDHELRFLPSLQLARQRIQRGDLGALRHVESYVIGGGRGDPNREWNWWSDAEQGGGLLGAIGSHQFDTLQFLLGPIAAVNGIVHTFIDQRPSETGLRPVTADDYSALLLRFASGGLGTITMSVVAATSAPNRMTAHFEHGAIRFEAGRLLVADRSAHARRGGHFSPQQDDEFEDITPQPSVDIPAALRDAGEFAHGTVYLGHALKQALTGDCTALAPAATFGDGHRVQRLLDAVRQSSASNSGWIDIQD